MQNSLQLIAIFKNVQVFHFSCITKYESLTHRKEREKEEYSQYKIEHFVCFLSRLSSRNKRNEESNSSWCFWDSTLCSSSSASPLFSIFLRLGESFASRLQRFSASLLSHPHRNSFFFPSKPPQLKYCTSSSFRIVCNQFFYHSFLFNLVFFYFVRKPDILIADKIQKKWLISENFVWKQFWKVITEPIMTGPKLIYSFEEKDLFPSLTIDLSHWKRSVTH